MSQGAVPYRALSASSAAQRSGASDRSGLARRQRSRAPSGDATTPASAAWRVVHRDGAERQLTAAAERRHHRALGVKRDPGRRVVDRRHRPRASRRRPAGSRSRRCPGRGRHAALDGDRRRDPLRRGRAAACPAAASTSASILAGVELAQPRVDVAANRHEPRARRGAARAARCGGRCSVPIVGAVAERAPARRRSSRAACRRGRTRASRGSSRGSVAAIVEPVGQRRRHVLGAVHREVDRRRASSASSISLTNSRFAAGLGQRRVLQPIAARLDDDELAPSARGLEQAGDGLRLPQRERGCRACRSAALVTPATSDASGSARARPGPAPG